MTSGADAAPPGGEKLSGQGRCRLRQGNCRIIFAIANDVLPVVAVKGGHRRDVYHND